jgi:hypothetical protein
MSLPLPARASRACGGPEEHPSAARVAGGMYRDLQYYTVLRTEKAVQYHAQESVYSITRRKVCAVSRAGKCVQYYAQESVCSITRRTAYSIRHMYGRRLPPRRAALASGPAHTLAGWPAHTCRQRGRRGRCHWTAMFGIYSSIAERRPLGRPGPARARRRLGRRGQCGPCAG